MYAAKCLTVLVVVAGLGIMFVLARKKTNQVMLAIAATILVGGVLRLFQLKDGEGSIYTMGAIFAGMGLIWLLSWYTGRAASRRQAAAAEKSALTQSPSGGRSLIGPLSTPSARAKPPRRPPSSRAEALGRAFGKMLDK